jgi:salicylate hydroxylase
MIHRTTPKVKDSAAAAKFLHSKQILQVHNKPRGRLFKI